MIVTKLVSKDFIILPLHSSNAEGVILELLAPLEKAGAITSSEHCLHSILKRERRMSTAVGKGVALPHGLSSEVNEVYVVLGISKNGIDFRAVDNLLCHIFVLMISPQAQPEKHLKVLTRFTKLLSDGDMRSALLEAQTVEQVLEIFKEQENRDDEDSF
ncbi:MAG: PTS sugar transporter subunit IIA [Candidatus Neomarinimicrobiota bacterium]